VVYVIVVTINLVVMMVDSLISEDGGMEGWWDYALGNGTIDKWLLDK